MSLGFRPDPRGLSGEGMKLLTDHCLEMMSLNKAGEGREVAVRARAHLLIRETNEAIHKACPLWALSPYERELCRTKNIPIVSAGKYWRRV